MRGMRDIQMSAKDRISGKCCVEEPKLSLNEQKLAISRCVCVRAHVHVCIWKKKERGGVPGN